MSQGTENENLSGRQILLIAIPRSAVHQAHFFTGTAEMDETGVGLRTKHGSVPRFSAPSALRSFPPSMLSKLVLSEQYAKLKPLLMGVEACVPVFADSVPGGGLVLDDAFFGIARGASGEVLLFQGED
jgi:hypothetical protein